MQSLLPSSLTPVATLGVAAASGLVLTQGALWVVADDGLQLHQLDPDGRSRARHALFPGRPPLPEEAKARKKAKPDLEALCVLPDGRLLALGSGSRAQRRLGSLFDPATARVQPIDLAPLYLALEAELPELNLEGAVVWRESLVLAHRGNSAGAHDALVRLPLMGVLADLTEGALRAPPELDVIPVDVGAIDSSRLTLTDLAVGHDGALWFSAAAEHTEDRYEDGVCAGSVIGCFDAAFAPQSMWRVPGRHKIEGLACVAAKRWLLVADADDPGVPSPLLAFVLP